MIESQEDIDFTLSRAGEDIYLESLAVYIKAIPGQTIYNVQNFDSVYDITKQDYSFTISAKEYYARSLISGSVFTYSTASIPSKKFKFKITSMLPDLTGWVKLIVTLTGIDNV